MWFQWKLWNIFWNFDFLLNQLYKFIDPVIYIVCDFRCDGSLDPGHGSPGARGYNAFERDQRSFNRIGGREDCRRNDEERSSIHGREMERNSKSRVSRRARNTEEVAPCVDRFLRGELSSNAEGKWRATGRRKRNWSFCRKWSKDLPRNVHHAERNLGICHEQGGTVYCFNVERWRGDGLMCARSYSASVLSGNAHIVLRIKSGVEVKSTLLLPGLFFGNSHIVLRGKDGVKMKWTFLIPYMSLFLRIVEFFTNTSSF